MLLMSGLSSAEHPTFADTANERAVLTSFGLNQGADNEVNCALQTELQEHDDYNAAIKTTCSSASNYTTTGNSYTGHAYISVAQSGQLQRQNDTNNNNIAQAQINHSSAYADGDTDSSGNPANSGSSANANCHNEAKSTNESAKIGSYNVDTGQLIKRLRRSSTGGSSSGTSSGLSSASGNGKDAHSNEQACLKAKD